MMGNTKKTLSLLTGVLLFTACSTPLPVKNDDQFVLQTFREPPLAKINAQDGSTELVAAHSGSLPNLELLYNGIRPGVTINMDPGGTHQVKLTNNLKLLSVNDIKVFEPLVTGSNDTDTTLDMLSAKSNITNLHTHGLHVSPQDRSDNVFLKLEEGKSNNYTYELPSDHAPGTHWYHAHLHGSTALQVQGGMSGALIVKAPRGQSLNPPDYPVTEKIIVLQTGATDSPLASKLKTFTVNGVLKPRIQMNLAGVQRFRVVNAGSRNADYKNVWVSGHDMYLAAFDGINLTSLPRDAQNPTGYLAYNEANPLILAPGNRADVYFIPASQGRHSLMMKSELGIQQSNSSKKHIEQFTQELMTIEVVGSGSNSQAELVQPEYEALLTRFLRALDANLNILQETTPYRTGYLRPLGEPDLQREMKFNVTPRGENRIFSINGRDYNRMDGEVMGGSSDYLGKVDDDGGRGPSGQTPWPIREGTIERWVITNTSAGKHPFHIHTNPFWVESIFEDGANVSSDDPRLNRWQDTVNLPPGGAVTIKHRFTKFEGLFVVHCHILNHEDRGMMINILIAPHEAEDAQAYFDLQIENNNKINEEINGS